jgi:NADH:ubiquinone oxidoreductase subunit B-like Fe-S oxidoreductase
VTGKSCESSLRVMARRFRLWIAVVGLSGCIRTMKEVTTSAHDAPRGVV